MKNKLFINKVLLTFVIMLFAVASVNATVLQLENKDTNWDPVLNDNVDASVNFNDAGPTFDYTLNARGLEPNTEYSLIYYADKPDRFVDWGGDNPGALIGTGFS